MMPGSLGCPPFAFRPRDARQRCPKPCGDGVRPLGSVLGQFECRQWVDSRHFRSVGHATPLRPSTNPLRGIGAAGELYSAPEPLTDEASKVGALPQTPPGAEPLDLNTYARFR